MPQEKKLTGYPSIDKPWLKYYKPENLDFQVPKCRIYDHMKEQTKDYTKNIALDYYGVKVSYRKMHEKIEHAAKSLRKSFIKMESKEDFVGEKERSSR